MTSHGVLAAGGIVAMVLGAMILIKSPWPEARIHLPTALSVALPLGVITVILLRFAVAAKRRKAVTGEAGMIGLVGVAQTDLDPTGESNRCTASYGRRARQHGFPRESRVRVREIEGLTLVVESTHRNPVDCNREKQWAL